jgi:hypothetical protein
MARIKRYADESLLEIFGTTRPNQTTINRWKFAWRDTKGKVEVESFSSARRILAENDIDPLFYQSHATAIELTNRIFIVFFYEEHEVFFKLHS